MLVVSVQPVLHAMLLFVDVHHSGMLLFTGEAVAVIPWLLQQHTDGRCPRDVMVVCCLSKDQQFHTLQRFECHTRKRRRRLPDASA